MPRYTYVCQACGQSIVLIRPIAERDTLEVGCTCGGSIIRVPDAPEVKVVGGTPRFHK